MQQQSRSSQEGSLLLQRKPRLSAWQSLGVCGLLVLAMLGIALLGHWLDREGLHVCPPSQLGEDEIENGLCGT